MLSILFNLFMCVLYLVLEGTATTECTLNAICAEIFSFIRLELNKVAAEIVTSQIAICGSHVPLFKL